MSCLVPHSRTLRPIVWLLLSGLNLLWIAEGNTAQWVGSPTPVSTGGGKIEAGRSCGGFVDIDGDRLLFFEIFQGTWTDIVLPATHQVHAIQAAGDVVLVVMDDLLIAFDGPGRTAHQQPLQGTLLATGTNPSWSCGPQLATAITDQEFYVFDAQRDTWAVYPYSLPDYQSHRSTTAAADYVAIEVYRGDFSPVNFAYSLHTGTFAVADPGAASLAQGHLLDHGFAGQYGPWNGVQGMGYSAITGNFNHLAPSPSDISIGGEQIDRKRKELCHLWSLVGYDGDSDWLWFYLWVYDTLTDTWTSHTVTYDKSSTSGATAAYTGGAYTEFYSQDKDSHSYRIDTFSGRTHGISYVIPGLYGAHLGRVLGGDVAGHLSGYQFSGSTDWFCQSLDHPTGMLIEPARPQSSAYIAGQDYVSFAARDSGDPKMDIYFYHGPSNTLKSAEIWNSFENPNHDGTYVHAMVTNGDDTDIVFYSSIQNLMLRRKMPANEWPARVVGEDLVLVYRNGVDDFLFDARRGTLQSRGCDYAAGSLGEDVCLGIDPVAQELHAYSSLSGQWTTHPTDGLTYVKTGGTVGLGYRSDYRRYYGFAGDEDAWAELETAGMALYNDVGHHTALVMDTNRVWALWQDQATSAPEDDSPSDSSVARALDDIRCFPNPFNGRVDIAFRLPRRAPLRIEVFDPRGRRVSTLLDELRDPGDVRVTWSTSDVASGVYLVRVVADGHVGVEKVSLVQ